MAEHAPRRVAWVAAAAFGVHALRFADPSFALDDAWISFRVARNALSTGIPTFDPSQPAVEGFSNPLWTALSALWVWWPIDPIHPARAIGLLCGILAVYLACRLAAHLAPARPVAAAIACAAVVVPSGALAYHATNGLETGLWMLLVVAGVGATVTAGPWWRTAPLLALLVWCRPEGVVVALCLAGIAAARRQRAVGLTAVVFGAVATLVLLRLWLYGTWLPNTFWAKPPDLLTGATYAGGWVVAWAGAPIVAVLLVRDRAGVELAFVGAVVVAAVAWSGGDWMPGWRRLAEVSVVVAILAGIAAGRSRLGWGVAALAVFGSLTAAIRGTDSAAWYHEELAEVGRRAHRSGLTRIAAFDIGHLGWTFPGSILDLAGLTDATIAATAGRYAQKRWPAAYLFERDPELVVFTSATDPHAAAPVLIGAEDRLWRLLAADGRYGLWGASPAGGDFIALVVRDGVELPDPVWAGW